ncbi:MAG TPA: MarR family winged helix-turn-helix transcriptional regulator [Polyangiaceae bacterium]|jgi:DNA-binding MarR family transcriptional regulator|nr:MarR family winged helix-turn-helix transcriptional regulator [Polyangiaceae bacterium]
MPDFARTARKIARDCPTIRARQASRVLTRVYDDVLRPVGLQMSQFSVLVQIAAYGEAGATITSLAAELVMDRTTLTRNLRPLERAGLLRVARAPGDARARVVLLTHRGEKIIETAYPLWDAALHRVRALLGPRKLNALRAELSELIEAAPGFDEELPSGRSVKRSAKR